MARSIEEIESAIDRIESFLNDYEKAEDGYKRSQWHDHFADKLEPYCERMKTFNGPDFDLYSESYDEFNRDFKDLGEDEYIAQLTANIDKLCDKLRSALGEDKVELESSSEGTEVASHEDKGITANDISSEELDTKDEDETITSSENAKTRYEKRSASNKDKLKGWDPQKGLLRSDEECKEGEATPHEEDGEVTVDEIPGKVEKIDDTIKVEEKDEMAEFMKDLEKYKK